MKKNEERLSLGWLFFWFVFIPPIGYIWLFFEWASGRECIMRKNEKKD